MIEAKTLLLGSETTEFLVEVVIRSVVMFFLILVALRTSGKRGVRQLSIFELVIIIGLGSAAGDPMFYKDVGILPAVIVFSVVICFYRAATWLSAKFQPVERILEGSPLYLIRDGKFSVGDFDKEDLSQDEFFTELRVNHVEHLGQVRSAIIETSGEISLLFYRDEDVKYGLPLYPDLYKKKSEMISAPGVYACAYCGHTEKLLQAALCPVCKRKEWVEAIKTLRLG